MVATLVIHVIIWITTHLPTPEGWKAELDRISDTSLTIVNELEKHLRVQYAQF